MDELVIICILYNPSKECINKWQSFSNVHPGCIFVNNSAKGANYSRLPNYIPLQSNYGIAKAQNIGIFKAKKLGYKYLCFFDQDSTVSITLINSLLNEYKLLKSSGIKIGAIGPALQEINTGKIYKGSTGVSNNPTEVCSLISSGTLTDISVIDDVGPMNDKLFIDLVDNEWCWRAKSKGYRLFKSYRNVLQHQVGKKTISFLGYPIIVSSPFRYYYQYRNTIWLIKCKYAPNSWKKKVAIRRLIELFIVPFKTGNFTFTTENIIKGIKDGVKSKL